MLIIMNYLRQLDYSSRNGKENDKYLGSVDLLYVGECSQTGLVGASTVH